MPVKIIIALCLFFSASSSWALSLNEVIGAVTAGHPSILQSRKRTEKIDAMKRAAAWPMNPRVGVMFEESPQRDFGFGNADMTNYMVEQEIPNPLSLRYRTERLKHEKRSSEHMTVSVTREKIFEAKKIFFELIASRNALAAKNKLVRYYDQIISSLDKSYQTDVPQAFGSMGMATKMTATSLGDVLMAKMKRAEVEAELFDLNHAVKNLSSRLNLIMGRPAGQTLGNVVPPPLKSLKLSNAALETKLSLSNSDLKALSAMADKAKSEISLTRAEFWPGIMTEAAYNQRQNMENAYSLGFSMKLPLWFDKNAALVREAKAGHLEKRYRRQAVELDLKQELHFLAEHAREHYKIINAYRGEILPVAETAVNAALADHQASATTAISVLQKIVSYQEAVGMYWKMWSDYHVEFAMLENILGEDL